MESLLLSCKALSSSTTCRFIPAHGRPRPSPLGATLLIDETDRRATAAAAQLPFIGVLGILGHCKKAKVLSARCVHFWIAFAGNWAFELRSGSTGSF